MAVQVGRRSTYESTVGVKLAVEDAIYMISPFDVPLLGSYGRERRTVLGSENIASKKVEWLEDELVPASDALAGAIVTADVFITVDNRDYFKTNDLVRIEDEYLRITGTGTTAATLLVERSWGTPVAASHADNTAILILGTLPTEGDDPVSGINFTRTQPFNYTQIYQDEIEVTRTEEKQLKYGVQSEAAYQIGKRLRENAIKFEQQIILGTREEDTTNKRRSFGGLDFYIATGIDSTTTALTDALLLTQLQNSFNRGGNVDALLVGGTQKKNISAFDASKISLARDDNVRGSVVDFYDSDFGRVYIVLDRWVPLRFLLGVELQYINLAWFDRFFVEDLAKTGDRQQWQLIAEASMKVRNEKAHFKFTALE